MKIHKWLNNPMSAINGIAIVRVEPDEVADIEQMLVVVDGDHVGHFGVNATLIGTGEWDEKWLSKRKDGSEYIMGQFGFANASSMRKQTRFYKVFVDRD